MAELSDRDRTDGSGEICDEYSDDCQLIESLGKTVALSKGDYRNIKLTTAEDFVVAEAIIKQMRE